MPFPAECPICKTVLGFPPAPTSDPVKCPVCDSRFIIEGRKIAHLSYGDYYALLGIQPEADDAEIKKAVRVKVLEHHPDRNPGDPSAADRLREVIQAKELLTDPEKRRIYDGVYNAKALPRWTTVREEAFRQAEKVRAPQYRPAPGTRDSRYEEMVSEARRRSKRASEENIDHLIIEIEQILGSRGGYRGSEAQTLRSMAWGARGAVFMGLAFFLIGVSRGSFPGALVLSVLGGIIGWILGSNANALVGLVFLGGRILFAGFFLGVMISAYRMPSDRILFEPFITLTLSAIAGMAILGLYSLGVGAFSGNRRSSLRFDAVRNGTLGAWLGGLGWMFAVYLAPSGGKYETVVLAWFILFSLYLLLDINLFSRPIIVLY
jgi:hypothetical protein